MVFRRLRGVRRRSGAAVLLAIVVVAAVFHPLSFLAPQKTQTRRGNHLGHAGAHLGAVLTAMGTAVPVFAEEAAGGEEAAAEFLNFGRIPLGGGFEINLDIPEVGIVNLTVLVIGLATSLWPMLMESMEKREAEIQRDIDDAVAKFEEAEQRLHEAKKQEAQAEIVVEETEKSVLRQQIAFKNDIEASTRRALEEQAKKQVEKLETLKQGAVREVQDYVRKESLESARNLLVTGLTPDMKNAITELAIEAL